MPSDCSAGFDRWIADLETRHLRDMTPAEVARALRALSSTYVERRARLSGRGAFDTAGKRAAYALYYAPRRFLTTAHVVAALTGPQPVRLTDLGCGTGAAGAAWVCRAGDGSSVTGLDVHPWAVDEARATYRAFGLDGTARARHGRRWRRAPPGTPPRRDRADAGGPAQLCRQRAHRRPPPRSPRAADRRGRGRDAGAGDGAGLAADVAVVAGVGAGVPGRRRAPRRMAAADHAAARDPARARCRAAPRGLDGGPR